MWTEDELPDTDLALVYGREALQARRLARVAAMSQHLDALLQRQHEGIARLDALLARMQAREWAWQARVREITQRDRPGPPSPC